MFGAKKNVHVQHLAGNILVQVSDSLVESVRFFSASSLQILESLYLPPLLYYILIYVLREVHGMISFACFVTLCT